MNDDIDIDDLYDFGAHQLVPEESKKKVKSPVVQQTVFNVEDIEEEKALPQELTYELNDLSKQSFQA